MRTKVISLCDETWQLACDMENFSMWVRSQLLMLDEGRLKMAKAADAYLKQHGTYPEWWA